MYLFVFGLSTEISDYSSRFPAFFLLHAEILRIVITFNTNFVSTKSHFIKENNMLREENQILSQNICKYLIDEVYGDVDSKFFHPRSSLFIYGNIYTEIDC